MKFRISQSWIFDFASRLLKEAGIEEHEIDVNLESFVYEAGERKWDEYEDDNGDEFYWIEWDL